MQRVWKLKSCWERRRSETALCVALMFKDQEGKGTGAQKKCCSSQGQLCPCVHALLIKITAGFLVQHRPIEKVVNDLTAPHAPLSGILGHGHGSRFCRVKSEGPWRPGLGQSSVESKCRKQQASSTSYEKQSCGACDAGGGPADS